MEETALKKRLGARLLVERIQEKGWNESVAAQAAGINPKTVRRIERGQNYEIDSLEKYAIALGRPLSTWLRELLVTEETQRSAASASGMVPAQATGTAGYPFRSDRRTTDLGAGPQGERRRASDR